MSRPPSGRVRLVAASLGAIVLVLALALFVDRFDAPVTSGPVLSVHSTLESGARALFLWAAESGYQTSALEYRQFRIDPKTKMLFVLAPDATLTEAHASEIVAWVGRGGTLIASVDKNGPLLDKLGARVTPGGLPAQDLVPLQPLFPGAPVRRVEAGSASGLEFSDPEWVPFLGPDDASHRVVGAVARLGTGRVYLLATHDPLSNGGLLEADNWALASYFLAAVPVGSRVVFDEYHHGFTEYGTLERRLFGEPWGWAILYSGMLLFAYVALSGRRFGPPVTTRVARTRRARAEYVSTVSGLLRQGRHGRWLCREYAAQVRRELGRRFQVHTDLTAAEFAAAIARTRPEAAGLALPLERLENAPVRDDAAMLALIKEVEELHRRLLDRPVDDAVGGPAIR